MKLVQMSFGSEYADVYHIGKHNCTLQPEVCSDVEYTRKWLERYPGLTFKQMKSAVMQHLIDSGDVEAAYRIPPRLSVKG